MFNLWKQKQYAFGIDISDTAIKVMQLEKSGLNYRVLGFLDHALPKGIIANDAILNESALINHIANILRHPDFGKIKGRNAVVSIPESKAFVRVMQIPKSTEEQVAGAVPFEVEQYIPIPVDQAYLDWQIIGERDEKINILVAAAAKEYVDPYLRILKAAGLKPIVFEVESAACARALIGPEQLVKSVLIVDMNSHRTSMVVVEKGQVQFTSSIPIAGEALTLSVSRVLGVNLEEAEKTKRTIGLDPASENQKVVSALSQVLDGLVQEIRNTIKFHDEHNNEKITQIILSGSGAKLPHFSAYLYDKLKDLEYIEIFLANPWVNTHNSNLKSPAIISRTDSLGYSTAVGLAIRAVNQDRA